MNFISFLFVIVVVINATNEPFNNSDPIKQQLNLVSYIIHYLIKHQDRDQLFEDLLYPIAVDEPQLFNSIAHKLLQTNFSFNIFTIYFIKTLSIHNFDNYIEIDNSNDIQYNKNDFWKLFQMFSTEWIIKSVSMKVMFDMNGDNKFHIYISSDFLLNPTHFFYYNDKTSMDGINWSEIPSFISDLRVISISDQFVNIDLSALDQSCKLRKLKIKIKNGCICLPDYSFPSSLKELSLMIDKPGHIINYHKLWQIGSNIKSLDIVQPKSIQLIDIHGFETMISLQYLCMNMNKTLQRSVTNKIRRIFNNDSLLHPILYVYQCISYRSNDGILRQHPVIIKTTKNKMNIRDETVIHMISEENTSKRNNTYLYKSYSNIWNGFFFCCIVITIITLFAVGMSVV